ncbi:MAG: hypothetical protein BWY42_00641 [Candidatus Omnitrophica bacterium ADurb.Bin277]|nr:MAG: hypothetical protein BWY42_00641 [Candidatus Omnitrophica bacterium ADurb.Bin277]
MEENIKKNSRGFTIIELMIALFVSALAISGYIGANIVTQRQAEALNERAIAIQEANRVIEQMRNASAGGIFPANVVAAFPNDRTVPGMNALTNEQVRVSYASTTAEPLDATITVTWLSHTGRSSTAALRTYISKRT